MYFKTTPKKLFSDELFSRFSAHLNSSMVKRFGLQPGHIPYVSMYSNGCFQAIHNDAGAGRFGYVYSITDWKNRTFSGGETGVFHDNEYYASGKHLEGAATTSFYKLVPAEFNQLLLFDDRSPHFVTQIQGTMRPDQARVVIHGHLVDAPPSIYGGLAMQSIGTIVEQIQGEILDKFKYLSGKASGVMTFRLEITEKGGGSQFAPLIQRILPLNHKSSRAIIKPAQLGRVLMNAKFPESEGPSQLVFGINIDPV
jgi:hypothetical protein